MSRRREIANKHIPTAIRSMISRGEANERAGAAMDEYAAPLLEALRESRRLLNAAYPTLALCGADNQEALDVVLRTLEHIAAIDALLLEETR